MPDESYIKVISKEPVCGGNPSVTLEYHKDPDEMGRAWAFQYIHYDGQSDVIDRIYPGETKRSTVSFPPGAEVTFYLDESGTAEFPEITKTVRFPFLVKPEIDIRSFDYPETPCAGTEQSLRVLVEEVTENCSADFHVGWNGNRTTTRTVPAGGTEEVRIPFTVPREPITFDVNLIDEEKGEAVASRVASIDPRVPSLEVEEDLPSGRVCTGTTLSGSVQGIARGCTQRLKGKIVDDAIGEILAEFGPSDFSPGDRFSMSLTKSMPRRNLLLRSIVQRSEDGGWETVASTESSVSFRSPETGVAPLDAPSEGCPGSDVEGSTSVTATTCDQRVRARFVNAESGAVIKESDPVSLPEGESREFPFSLEMPWSDLSLKAITERRRGEEWVKISEKTSTVSLKAPRTSISSLRIPGNSCPESTLEGSVEVTADACSQRTRAKAVDEATGETIKDWTEMSISEGESSLFEFSVDMPWNALSARVDVERLDPLTGSWTAVGSASGNVSMKEPWTGIVTDREVPERGRPGTSIETRSVFENTGECEGDLRQRAILRSIDTSPRTRLSKTYTLTPGETREESFTGTMRPNLETEVLFIGERLREGNWVETFRSLEKTTASRSVILEDRVLGIASGEEEIAYSGVMVADEITPHKGPRSVERVEVPGGKVALSFEGKVPPGEEHFISVEGFDFLRATLTKSVTWAVMGDIKEEDTKYIEYGSPLVQKNFLLRRPIKESLISGLKRALVPEELDEWIEEKAPR